MASLVQITVVLVSALILFTVTQSNFSNTAYAATCEATVFYDRSSNEYKTVTVEFPLSVKERIGIYTGQYARYDNSDNDTIFLLKTELRSTEISKIMSEYGYSNRAELEDMGTPEDIFNYFKGKWGTKSRSDKNEDRNQWYNYWNTKFPAYATAMHNILGSILSSTGISLDVKPHQETCASDPVYKITFKAQVDGSSFSEIVTVDGTTYNTPITLEKFAGTHSIKGNVSPGYSFNQWKFSGGVSPSGSTYSDSTSFTVSGDGTVTLVLNGPVVGPNYEFSITDVDNANSREIGDSSPVWIQVDVKNVGNDMASAYVSIEIKDPDSKIVFQDTEIISNLRGGIQSNVDFNWKVPSSAKAGTYLINIKVNDEKGEFHDTSGYSNSFSITAKPEPTKPFDFSLSLSPRSDTIEAGKLARSTITVALKSGVPERVSLSCTISPSFSGNCDFGPNSVMPSDQSALKITTSSNTKAGTYQVTIIGTGGGLKHTETFSFTVKSDSSGTTGKTEEEVSTLRDESSPYVEPPHVEGFVNIQQNQYTISRYSSSPPAIIYGKIDDPNRGEPLVIEIDPPKGESESHTIYATKDGDFRLPYPFNPDSPVGTYRVTVTYAGSYIGSVSFKVIQEIIDDSDPIEKPPVDDSIGTITSSELIIASPNVSGNGDEYVFSGKIVKGVNTPSLVRVIAENDCNGKKEVHNRDYILNTQNTSFEFTFYQTNNSNNRCTLNFEISDFDGNKLKQEQIPYQLVKSKVEDVGDEQTEGPIIPSVPETQQTEEKILPKPNVKISFLDLERDNAVPIVRKNFALTLYISTDQKINDVKVRISPTSEILVPQIRTSYTFNSLDKPTFGSISAQFITSFKALTEGNHKVTALVNYKDANGKQYNLEGDYDVPVKADYTYRYDYDECITPIDDSAINFYVCPEALERSKTMSGAYLVASEIFAKKLLKIYGDGLDPELTKEISSDPSSAGMKLLALGENIHELSSIAEIAKSGAEGISTAGLVLGKITYDVGSDTAYLHDIATGANFVKTGYVELPNGGINYRTSMLGELMSISFWAGAVHHALTLEERTYTPEIRTVSDD